MDSETISNDLSDVIKKEDTYRFPSIKRLRIILMFLLCINLFGFPTAFGGMFQTVCGFVPIAFFIVSGYLVLRKSENRSERIVNAIKRSAVAFAVLAAVYFLINFLFYRSQNIDVFQAFKSKRFWFDFIVLNVWQFDIGSVIWYVQALLYAYIIIYFLNKLDLLKYDWLFAAVLILFTVITGELSGVIRWNILGYSYIPGNFLTRALPYILLGSFICRKMKVLKRLHKVWYFAAIAVGTFMVLLEVSILAYFGKSGYYGHLIGYGVIAASVCILAFMDKNKYGFETRLCMSRQHINIIYYICQPVSIIIVLLFSRLGNDAMLYLIEYVGVITFIVCFGIAWLISYIDRFFRKLKYHE